MRARSSRTPLHPNDSTSLGGSLVLQARENEQAHALGVVRAHGSELQNSKVSPDRGSCSNPGAAPRPRRPSSGARALPVDDGDLTDCGLVSATGRLNVRRALAYKANALEKRACEHWRQLLEGRLRPPGPSTELASSGNSASQRSLPPATSVRFGLP